LKLPRITTELKPQHSQEISTLQHVTTVNKEMSYALSVSTSSAYACSLLVTFFSISQQPLVAQGFFIIELSRSHSDTPHSR